MSDNSIMQPTGGAGMTPEQIAEHEKNMINISSAEGNKGTPEGDMILGKFKSQEDLATAYKNLESELGKLRSNPSTNSTEGNDSGDTNAEADNTDTSLDIKKADATTETKDDVSIDKLSDEAKNIAADEFRQSGSFSEDTIEKFSKAGISKDELDIYGLGLKAKMDADTNNVLDYVGGKEVFNQLKNWAASNLSDAELSAYGDAYASGNMDRVKVLLSGMKSQYEAANGTSFKPTDASSASGNAAPESFKSTYEMTQAIASPQYANDPAYRQAVEQKIRNSRF